MGDSICKFSSHMKASCSTPVRLALNNHQKSNKNNRKSHISGRRDIIRTSGGSFEFRRQQGEAMPEAELLVFYAAAKDLDQEV